VPVEKLRMEIAIGLAFLVLGDTDAKAGGYPMGVPSGLEEQNAFDELNREWLKG
jgi:hypothetical protein